MENKLRLTYISNIARADVINKFDKKNFINQYIDFYENLINPF